MSLNRDDLKRLHDLVRKECANYDAGWCCPRDKQCPQCKAENLVCKYFRDAVLPLDPSLKIKSTSTGEVRTKDCKICGRSFVPLKNNQVCCCAECSAKNEKKNAAARQRKHQSNNDSKTE